VTYQAWPIRSLLSAKKRELPMIGEIALLRPAHAKVNRRARVFHHCQCPD